ncbi:MAG: hypothetical protein ACYS9C_00635 [Planctomycetota bacterium]|jgi:hypothetical protein
MKAQRILTTVRKPLEYRHLPVVFAVIAFALSVPALWRGWESMDDLRHRAKLVEPSSLPPRLADSGLVPENSGQLLTTLSDLHTVVRTRSTFKKLRDYGLLPWWTQQGYLSSQWRPADSFTHWLDYQLFPDSAALIHVHSLLWFSAVILLVTSLYRQLMKPYWVAGLAALLYLLDDSNYVSASWICNRHLPIALVLAISCLLAYHRWRTTDSLAAAVVSHLCLLGSLLATEGAVAIFAYLFAYAVIVDHGSWLRRALSLVPAVLIIVLWRIVYSALGHGAYGSAFIIDPAREPLRFAGAVLERAPILLFAQWGGPPSATFSFARDSLRTPFWLSAVVFLILVLIVLWPMLRRNRLARFWLTAMLLSTLPICATLPMNRNLLFVAIGAFGLMAQFIGSLWTKEEPLAKMRLWRVLAWVFCIYFLLAHVLFATVGRVATQQMINFSRKEFDSTMQVGELDGVENQDLIIVNAPNPFSLFYLPTYRAHNRQSLPRTIRTLAPGFRPIEVVRTGEKTLLLRAKSGNLLSCRQIHDFHFVYFYRTFNNGFRDDRSPMHAGDKVVLHPLTVEVVAVDSNDRPTEVLFSFVVSLADPSLRWLVWDWDKELYKPFIVPAIGQKSELVGPF